MQTMQYGVIICPRCSAPRVADLRVKTTKCSSCGRTLQMKKMRLYGLADSPQELISRIGELNRERRTLLQALHAGGEEAEYGLEEWGKGQEGRRNGPEEGESGQEGRENERGEGEMDTVHNEQTDPSVHEERSDRNEDHPGTGPQQLSSNRMDRLREALTTMGEFAVEDLEQIVMGIGWKREKGVELLLRMMESGEAYSPRKGWFRMVP